MPQPKYLAMYILAFFLVVAIVSSIPRLTKSYLTQHGAESRLLVGTNVWPGYEPLFLAQGLGKMPGDKVRLVEYSSATQVARALSNGVVDAAALTLDEALRVAALGVDVDVVLVLDISAGGDVILAHPEFKDFHALKGRRIGVESTALGGFLLQRALDLHGMTRDDITVVSLEVDEHEQAVLQQTIDAVITFEPVASRLRSAGLVEVFSSNEIPGEIVDVLVVRSERVAQHLDALKLLTNAWFDALDYLSNEPADAYRRMAPRLNTSAKQVASSLKTLHFPTRLENMDYLRDQGALQRTIDRILPVLQAFDDVRLEDAGHQIANPVLLDATAP